LNRLISIAPMMNCTDRHFRYLLRLLSRHVLLYTEMITTGAILYGPRERLLAYHPSEHPLALQLGGNDPQALAECTKIAADKGYDEVNLNVGCPSEQVFNGQFGACLMKQPQLVADCVAAMQAVVKIPITVKTRIGVDDLDSYEYLQQFIQKIAQAGCQVFIIHARKAWLKGLSPKENREIPPLRYDVVLQLKKDFPQLGFVINGGIKTWREAQEQLQRLDGIMLGREVYRNPYMLADADRLFYSEQAPIPSRHEILDQWLGYVAEQLQQGVPLQQMSRHIFGLFEGVPGARAWRRHISENVPKQKFNSAIIREAACFIEKEESQYASAKS
jgi:tRNA-dihydrouridine synthase A